MEGGFRISPAAARSSQALCELLATHVLSSNFSGQAGRMQVTSSSDGPGLSRPVGPDTHMALAQLGGSLLLFRALGRVPEDGTVTERKRWPAHSQGPERRREKGEPRALVRLLRSWLSRSAWRPRPQAAQSQRLLRAPAQGHRAALPLRPPGGCWQDACRRPDTG